MFKFIVGDVRKFVLIWWFLEVYLNYINVKKFYYMIVFVKGEVIEKIVGLNCFLGYVLSYL